MKDYRAYFSKFPLYSFFYGFYNFYNFMYTLVENDECLLWPLFAKAMNGLHVGEGRVYSYICRIRGGRKGQGGKRHRIYVQVTVISYPYF